MALIWQRIGKCQSRSYFLLCKSHILMLAARGLFV